MKTYSEQFQELLKSLDDLLETIADMSPPMLAFALDELDVLSSKPEMQNSAPVYQALITTIKDLIIRALNVRANTVTNNKGVS